MDLFNINFISTLLLFLCAPFLIGAAFLGVKHVKQDRGITLLMVIAIVSCVMLLRPLVPAGYTMAVLVFLRFGIPGIAMMSVRKAYAAHQFSSARSWANVVLALWPRRHVRKHMLVMCALCDYRSGSNADAAQLRLTLDGPQLRQFDGTVLVLERRWKEYAELLDSEPVASRSNLPSLTGRMILSYWMGDASAVVPLYRQILTFPAARASVRFQQAAKFFILQITGEVAAVQDLSRQRRESAPGEKLVMGCAMALWASGRESEARDILEPMTRHSEYWVRQEARTRLDNPPIPAEKLPAELRAFGAQVASKGAPPIESSIKAPATTILVGLLIMVCMSIVVYRNFFYILDHPERDLVEDFPTRIVGGLCPSLLLEGQVWRLASSLFVITDATLLIISIFGIGMLGIMLEKRLRWQRYLMVFFGAGILGNLIGCSSALVQHRDPMIIGDSAGIMGLSGGVLATALCGESFPPPRNAFAAAAFVIVLQGMWDFTGQDISIAAQLGGLLSGFLGTWFLLRRY